MQDHGEIEAIKQLKYRYIRCLDLKRWDEMAECLCDDVRSAYGDGKYSFQGREALLEFLRTSLGRDMITAHHVHQPEIELTSATAARGTWALEDTVINPGQGFTVRGAAFYEDEYEKVDGRWRIKSTGYRRLYEEFESRQERPGLRLTANRWADIS
ncbi:MAG: nuclear transport factor 2 family protein [Myxococcota bacterium]